MKFSTSIYLIILLAVVITACKDDDEGDFVDDRPIKFDINQNDSVYATLNDVISIEFTARPPITLSRIHVQVTLPDTVYTNPLVLIDETFTRPQRRYEGSFEFMLPDSVPLPRESVAKIEFTAWNQDDKSTYHEVKVFRSDEMSLYWDVTDENKNDFPIYNLFYHQTKILNDGDPNKTAAYSIQPKDLRRLTVNEGDEEDWAAYPSDVDIADTNQNPTQYVNQLVVPPGQNIGTEFVVVDESKINFDHLHSVAIKHLFMHGEPTQVVEEPEEGTAIIIRLRGSMNSANYVLMHLTDRNSDPGCSGCDFWLFDFYSVYN